MKKCMFKIDKSQIKIVHKKMDLTTQKGKVCTLSFVWTRDSKKFGRNWIYCSNQSRYRNYNYVF